MDTANLLGEQVAIVTGAARGLGFGIATMLAEHGARVALNDVNAEALNVAVQGLQDRGLVVAGFAGNVSDARAVDTLVTQVTEQWGPTDILVNNAGINRDGLLIKMAEDDWRKVLDVDLTGPFLLMRRILPTMVERKTGRIINMSSASWLGNFGQANYAAAKAGLVGLTKTASRETARYGITVNAICPGFIETEMTRSVPEKVWDKMVAKIPAGRVGQPQDVARVVVFLASDYAAYVTGEVINVGGGMVL